METLIKIIISTIPVLIFLWIVKKLLLAWKIKETNSYAKETQSEQEKTKC